MSKLLESLKNEYKDFVDEAAEVVPFPKKAPATMTPTAAPTAVATKPVPAAPGVASKVAGAARTGAQAAGTQFKSELGSRLNKGFAGLGAYDEYTRRRGQPEWKRIAGAAVTGASEYVGGALGGVAGTAAGALAGGPAAPVTAPVGGVTGGIYGATKGYEVGQKAADYLLGSPGEEAVGDVSKKAAELAEPVGRAIGRGIGRAKASPAFSRDDQSYI